MATQARCEDLRSAWSRLHNVYEELADQFWAELPTVGQADGQHTVAVESTELPCVSLNSTSSAILARYKQSVPKQSH